MKRDVQGKIKLKSYLKIQEERPKKALKILKSQPHLATARISKPCKWIEGSTALHWAAHQGSLELVKRLVKLGADINDAQADWWCRPIDWAADSGSFEIVDYLIKKGADLSGDQWSNCTPLHVAAQGGSTNGKKRKKRYGKTANLLIQGNCEINALAQYGGGPPAMTPLDDALKVGNKIVAQVIQRAGGLTAKEIKDKRTKM